MSVSASAQAPSVPPNQTDSAAMQAAHAAEQEQAMQAADAEARSHFNVGKALLDSGRFSEAAQEFDKAYRLSGRPQLLYNLYVAHRDAGNTPNAIVALRAYLNTVPDAPDRVNLEARLASLEEQERHHVEQEEATRRAREEAALAKAQAAKRTHTVVEKSKVPWILMASGGALVAASIGTGVAALNTSKDLEDNCYSSTSCPSSQKGNIDKTQALSLTTDVLWAVGGASLVTGFVLWVTGALDEKREVPITSVAIAPGVVSATLTKRF
jgi:tetratricopeptide (TPR) repeat protein